MWNIQKLTPTSVLRDSERRISERLVTTCRFVMLTTMCVCDYFLVFPRPCVMSFFLLLFGKHMSLMSSLANGCQTMVMVH